MRRGAKSRRCACFRTYLLESLSAFGIKPYNVSLDARADTYLLESLSALVGGKSEIISLLVLTPTYSKASPHFDYPISYPVGT